MKLRKLLQYPILMVFGMLCMAGFIGYLCKKDTIFSQMENRYLEKRPGLSVQGLLDATYMRDFETYTNEQIPLRDWLVNLKAFSERVLLKNENNGIVLGKDGYLFEKVLTKNPQLNKNEKILETFLKEQDRPVYVAIAPNASEVMKEYVPAGIVRVNQEQEIQDFYQRIGSDYVKTVDLLTPLRESSVLQKYYRTDHHWTSEGAYVAYTELCRVLQETPVALTELESEEVPDFYGTLYAKYKGGLLPPDTILRYDIPIKSLTIQSESHDTLYDKSKDKVYDKYASFLYGNPGMSTINARNAGNGRSLIVFKDSYANCLIPFLTYQYDTIIVVDLRYHKDNVSDLLKNNPTADILLLYNFSHLSDDNHFYRILEK